MMLSSIKRADGPSLAPIAFGTVLASLWGAVRVVEGAMSAGGAANETGDSRTVPSTVRSRTPSSRATNEVRTTAPPARVLVLAGLVQIAVESVALASGRRAALTAGLVEPLRRRLDRLDNLYIAFTSRLGPEHVPHTEHRQTAQLHFLPFCRREETTALAALTPIAAAAAARPLRTGPRRIAFVVPVAICSTIRSVRLFLCNSPMIVSTPGYHRFDPVERLRAVTSSVLFIADLPLTSSDVARFSRSVLVISLRSAAP